MNGLLFFHFTRYPSIWVYVNHNNNCPLRSGCNDFTSLTERYVLSNLGSEVQSQKTNGYRCICNTLKSTFFTTTPFQGSPYKTSRIALKTILHFTSNYSSVFLKIFFTLLESFPRPRFFFSFFFLLLPEEYSSLLENSLFPPALLAILGKGFPPSDSLLLPSSELS